MREYEKTHKWITFELDTRKFPFDLWVALGEAQSKCEHISGVPLKPGVAQEMHNLFLAKGIRATTAIEGNTLTEDEVRKRIDGKLPLPPSREYLGTEVDNMIKAINKVKQDVIQEERDGITPDEIKTYNRQILEGLTLEEKVIPGEIRTYNVSVGRYWGPPAADCDYLLGRLCEWVNEIVVPAGMGIVFGILKAIIAHLYLEWIHPFGDGNGRVGRLVEFKFLLEAGVPTPAAHLLSNHYNQTRNEYYRVLDQASKSGGDISSFISYAVKGYVDGLREQIETIRVQQLSVSWADYAQEILRKKKRGGTKDRQTQLVLDLARKYEPVPMDKIREISPKVAESYAGKTRKTIVRDLNELMTAGLITFEPGVGYRVSIEAIFAFLPAKRHQKEKVPQGTEGSGGSGGT